MKRLRREEQLAARQARHQAKMARRQAREEQHTVVGCKSILKREQAIQLLEEVLAGLKTGKITLEQAEQKVQLHPHEVMRASIRASQKADSESVKISLRWPRVSDTDQPPGMKVSSE